MVGSSSTATKQAHPFLRAGAVSLLIHLGVALAIAIGARMAPRVAALTVDLIIEGGEDAAIPRPNLAGGVIGPTTRDGPDQPDRPRGGDAPTLAVFDPAAFDAFLRPRETAAAPVNDDSTMAPTLIVAFESASLDIGGARPAPSRLAAIERPPAAPRAALPTQTPGDFVRAQILARWRLDWRDSRFNGRSLTIEMVVLSTGMFAYPYGRDDPWNPRAMVTNYDELVADGQQDLVEMVESLLHAMRAAQPIDLPARLRRFPMRLDLSFRLGADR